MIKGETIILNEGWVRFVRYYCKEGYIDRWMGDVIDDPNLPNKNQMQLNSTATYYRFNGSKWISDRELGRMNMLNLLQLREGFSAQEIWDEVLINEAKRRGIDVDTFVKLLEP